MELRNTVARYGFVARSLHWSLFGWFDLPALGSPGSEEREHLIEEVHETLFNVMLILAIVHVPAALKHHFIARDNVLRRMLPGSR